LELCALQKLFITHLHLDHTGDLPSLLFSLRNAADLPENYELHVYGPKGIQRYVNRVTEAHRPWLTSLPFVLRTEELLRGKRSFIDWRLQVVPMQHSSAALGYRFEQDSRALAVSGDTDYCPEVIELCRNAHTAILECSTPDAQKVDGHLTPSLAATIAQEAQSERLILTHIYPQTDEIDIVALCKNIYSGEVLVAEDLMTITV
jgi:ribonuclease BN (tRNA processing enzyme)